MKKSIKDLTEGMQRLCATANRIVAHPGEVSRIERDLLLDNLRQLYEVALTLGEAESGKKGEESEKRDFTMPDDELLSSTVMATMAAMAPGREEREDTPLREGKEAEPVVVVEPKPMVVAEPVEIPSMEELEGNDNSLLFDEVIINETPEVREVPEVQEAPKTPEAPAIQEEPKVPEAPAIPETSKTPEVPEVQETPKAPEVPEVQEAPETPETPAIPETPKAPETPEPEPKKEHKKEHKAAGTQASLLDYLKRPMEEKPTVRTLGEKLGGVEGGERRVESDVMSSKKVSDLRTVININDKFSFMSELFHNNMKAYNDFILRLNAIDNRDEALMCVNEVSVQYKWDESSLAVQSFYKVFDKKF